jgi:hypothetical protein
MVDCGWGWGLVDGGLPMPTLPTRMPTGGVPSRVCGCVVVSMCVWQGGCACMSGCVCVHVRIRSRLLLACSTFCVGQRPCTSTNAFVAHCTAFDIYLTLLLSGVCVYVCGVRVCAHIRSERAGWATRCSQIQNRASEDLDDVIIYLPLTTRQQHAHPHLR